MPKKNNIAEAIKSPESLELLLEGMEERLNALELQNAARPEPESNPKIKSPESLMKAELNELDKTPEDRVADKVAGGLTPLKAAGWVERRKKFLRAELGIKAALVLFMSLLGLAAPAFAQSVDTQGLPQSFPAITNQPATVAAGTVSNILCYVPLRNKIGIGLQWQFNQSGASTAIGTLAVYPSIDGTNIGSAPFALLAAASQGTTNVTATTNWSGAQLEGMQGLVIGWITNAATTTLTNKGIVVRRPNS